MSIDAEETRIWIEQPSSECYERLAGTLINVERDRSSGKISDLRAAFESLRAAIEFLHSDAQLAEHRAASSLGAMAAATHDLLNGAKPQLFFKREINRRKGAPTNLSRAAVRAQGNVALDSLIEAGIPIAEGCKWFAQELAREGVKLAGRRIEAKQIKAWHYEKDGKSLSGSDRAYEILKVSRGDRPNTEDAAKKIARARILALEALRF